MDEETRAAFGRMDRYFELAQLQHLELRADIAGLAGRVERVEHRLDRLEGRLDSLESSFSSLRDWVAAQLADLWVAIREISIRLERLERQHDGAR